MINKRLKKSKGQSLAEYGLILALIAVVAIAGLGQLGGAVDTNLKGVSSAISTSTPGAAGTFGGGGG